MDITDRVPFIAEFEVPLIENKQISGPANGSAQHPGTYQVCYEKINHITEQRDTCCFKITVTCNTASVNTASGDSLIDHASALNGVSQNLRMAVSPNPSSNGFSLNITSKSYEPVSLQIMNIKSKLIIEVIIDLRELKDEKIKWEVKYNALYPLNGRATITLIDCNYVW